MERGVTSRPEEAAGVAVQSGRAEASRRRGGHVPELERGPAWAPRHSHHHHERPGRPRRAPGVVPQVSASIRKGTCLRGNKFYFNTTQKVYLSKIGRNLFLESTRELAPKLFVEKPVEISKSF